VPVKFVSAIMEEHALGAKGHELPYSQSQFDGEFGEEAELREARGILRRYYVCCVE
jgi:hypothetical protein